MSFFKFINLISLYILGNTLYSQEIVPFIYKENKRVFIEVNINNSEKKFLFFFDTGATSPMINHKAAEELNIKPTFQESFSGASGEKVFQIAEKQSLSLNSKIKLNDIDFIIDDMTRLNESTGIKFDGIIGFELLDSFITEMDFDRKEFIFYNSIEQVNLTKFKAYPFTWPTEIPIPHFPLTITLNNQKTYTGTVLFDSGAGLGLLINSKFQQKNNLLDQFDKKIIGSSNDLTGKGQTTISTIASLKFLDFNFNENMITHIASDESGVNAMPGYLGILGADIINRFNYVFDYKNMLIYVKPNQRFNDPFSTDFAPINLISRNNNITISHVVPNTNADLLGLETDDVILEINDKKTNDIFEARRILLQTGKKIKLKLKKKNKKILTKEITIDLIL